MKHRDQYSMLSDLVGGLFEILGELLVTLLISL